MKCVKIDIGMKIGVSITKIYTGTQTSKQTFKNIRYEKENKPAKKGKY